MNRKLYRKIYEGKALISNSLPLATEIQGVLRRINDDFMHLNDQYYARHTEAMPAGPDHVGLLVHYFDRDDDEHAAHVLAFLHFLVVIQASLVGVLKGLFNEAANLDAGLVRFETQFRPQADRLVASAPHAGTILMDLGLWTLAKPAA